MVNVKFENLGNVTKRFNMMYTRATKNEPAMGVIAAKGYKNVIQHFSEQDGETGKWQMPKPATLRARANRANNKKSSSILALVDTGLLRNRIRFRAINNEAHVYSCDVYAPTHQYGDPSRNIPQRKFMWIAKPVQKNMIRSLLDYILKSS